MNPSQGVAAKVKRGAVRHIWRALAQSAVHLSLSKVNNVKEMMEQHGWNALMYQIAVGGNCPGERVRFFAAA